MWAWLLSGAPASSHRPKSCIWGTDEPRLGFGCECVTACLFLYARPWMSWRPLLPATGYSLLENGGMVGGQPDVCAPPAFCVWVKGLLIPLKRLVFRNTYIFTCLESCVVKGENKKCLP